jgi:hypothetical protein
VVKTLKTSSRVIGSVIRFLTGDGFFPLIAVCVSGVISVHLVRKWCRCFENGRRDTDGDESKCRPITLTSVVQAASASHNSRCTRKNEEVETAVRE